MKTKVLFLTLLLGCLAGCGETPKPPVKVTGISFSENTLLLDEGESKTLTYTITPSDASNKQVSFSTSKSNIATVTAEGQVTGVSEGTSFITVTTIDGGFSDICTVTVSKYVPVTGVEFAEHEVSITEGDSKNLIYSVLPSNASNKKVSFDSNNKNVATVDSTGKVSASAEGNADITVTTEDGNKKDTCKITVNKKYVSVNSVSFDKETYSLGLGNSLKLVPNILPENATNKNVSFVSETPSVATVTNDGLVTAKAEGTSKITVTTEDGGKTAFCNVEVTVKHVESVELFLKETVLSVGEKKTLSYKLNPSDCFNKNVSFSSSLPSVASVSQTGEVEALAAGKTVITVTTEDGNKTDTCEVTVSSKSSYDLSKFYHGYYEGFGSWTDGNNLKSKLSTWIHKGYTALKYEGNIENNTDADHTLTDYEVLDVIYSPDDVAYDAGGTVWQKEHAFPASVMTGETTGDAVKIPGIATDYHNLFAAAASGNSSHGNRPFGFAKEEKGTIIDRTTQGGYDGYKNDPTEFEPGNKDKGRVSRALFYMCTMYPELSMVEDASLTQKGSKKHGNLSEMLVWSNSTAVDRAEMLHNESVYSYKYKGTAQGNRNPFVDFPQLVDYVFGDKQNEAGTLEDIRPSAVDLNADNNEHANYMVTHAKRNYKVNETLINTDYSIIEVNNDFSTSEVSNYTNSLDNHVFTVNDDEKISAGITCNGETIYYIIYLNKATSCSYYAITKKAGIDKNKYNMETQTISYVSETGENRSFHFQFQSDAAPTLNDVTGAGYKIGSGTHAVSRLVYETVDSISVNKVVMKCRGANSSSTYSLTISIGGTQVFQQNVTYSKTEYFDLGGDIVTKSGKVRFEFTGANALEIFAIGLNILN